MTEVSQSALNKRILDEESGKLLSFFEKFNKVLLILNIIISIPISYIISAISIVSIDYTYSSLLFVILITFFIFISVFYYNLVLLILIHFSNMAELKQIKKIEYLKNSMIN